MFLIEYFDFDGFCDNAPIQGFDLVITLGGDGTVLFAARNSVENNIPIFPVNLGQFGFIASVQPNEWKTELEAFLNSLKKGLEVNRKSLDIKEGVTTIPDECKEVGGILSPIEARSTQKSEEIV